MTTNFTTDPRRVVVAFELRVVTLKTRANLVTGGENAATRNIDGTTVANDDDDNVEEGGGEDGDEDGNA